MKWRKSKYHQSSNMPITVNNYIICLKQKTWITTSIRPHLLLCITYTHFTGAQGSGTMCLNWRNFPMIKPRYWPLLIGIVILKINTIYHLYNNLSNISSRWSYLKIKHMIYDLSLLKMKVKFTPKNHRSLLCIITKEGRKKRHKT